MRSRVLRRTITFPLAALALSSCSVLPEEEEAQVSAEYEAATPVANDQSGGEQELQADSGKGIPDAMRGAWGLVVRDCTSDLGDAKGRMTIKQGSIEFYESVATLAEVQLREPDRLRASFAFSGEGETWNMGMALDLLDGGTTLIRRDFGPDALPGALEYERCSA